MDALVIHAPGDLRIEDVPTPLVQANQLRVRVRAGGICGSDLHYFQHGGFGTVRIKEPMVLGHEVAGIIAEAGRDVRHFGPGDRIALLVGGAAVPGPGRVQQHHEPRRRGEGAGARQGVQPGRRASMFRRT